MVSPMFTPPKNVLQSLMGRDAARDSAPTGVPGRVDFSKEIETYRKQGEKGLMQHKQAQEKIRALVAPKSEPALKGPQDLLLPILAALIAKGVFHAKDSDLAEGGAGFLNARGQMADARNADAMRRYGIDRENLEAEGKAGLVDAEYYGGKADRLQGREWNLQDQQTAEANRIADDDRARDLEVFRQGELTKRAEIRNPAKVEYYRMLGKTPEGRALLAQAVMGNDPDAIAAAKELTEAEKLTAANREFVQGPKTDNINAKTKTENELRPARLRKLDADVNKVLGGVKLDEARRKQLEARTARIPEEFRLRWANAMKKLGGGGGKVGREGISALKDIQSIANARIKRAQREMEAATDPKTIMELAREMAEASKERDAAEKSILELSKQVTSPSNGPRRQIDTKGGAGALKKPKGNPGWKVEIE